MLDKTTIEFIHLLKNTESTDINSRMKWFLQDNENRMGRKIVLLEVNYDE